MTITLVKTKLGEIIPESNFKVVSTVAIVLGAIFAFAVVVLVITKAVKRK